MKVFWITVFSLVIVLAAHQIVFYVASTKNYDPPSDAFTSLRSPFIIIPYENLNQWDSNFFTNVPNTDLVLWVNVFRDSDQKLGVAESADRFLKPLEVRTKLQTQKAEITLQEVLIKYSGYRFILNVLSNENFIDDQIIELIQSLQIPSLEEKLIIQSQYNNVLESIKNKKSSWLVGSSEPDFLRWKLFSALHLLPLAPFKKDVFFVTESIDNLRFDFSPILKELSHRNIKVIWGPFHKQSPQIEQLLHKYPNMISGLLIEY